MLRKQDRCKEEWDKLLKYCLLCFRASLHATTELSPFDLVHGKSCHFDHACGCGFG